MSEFDLGVLGWTPQLAACGRRRPSICSRAHRRRLQPRVRLLLLPLEAMLYARSRFRMADDLIEAYLRQLIEAHAAVPDPTIG